MNDFWKWTLNFFPSFLDSTKWYNGNETSNMTGYIEDFSSILIQEISMRQLRIIPGK
jgi:hypothetical protein